MSLIRRRRRRGYLLLEVMVGGALAASILGVATLSLLQMRKDRLERAKAVVAEQLLQERVAEAAAVGYGLVAGDLPTSPETITIAGGTYTRTTTISTGNTTFSAGTYTSGSVNYTDVTVDVEYTSYGTILQTDTALRMWEP